jgi:hypothetical protein
MQGKRIRNERSEIEGETPAALLPEGATRAPSVAEKVTAMYNEIKESKNAGNTN